jgi:hypothetical protein
VRPRGTRRAPVFVVGDVAQALLEGKFFGRGQLHRFILGVRADIGELLALDRVHFEIVVATMLADDHAFVHIDAGIDHHGTAVLEVPQRERH